MTNGLLCAIFGWAMRNTLAFREGGARENSLPQPFSPGPRCRVDTRAAGLLKPDTALRSSISVDDCSAAEELEADLEAEQ